MESSSSRPTRASNRKRRRPEGDYSNDEGEQIKQYSSANDSRCSKHDLRHVESRDPLSIEKQETQTKNSNDDTNVVLLTPHTLRLLKLIQEGDTEHAQIAAQNLTLLTAASSAIVLWDILGRLQCFLTSSNWRTRQNASIAMQGVAQHLPPLDQQQFLHGQNQNMQPSCQKNEFETKPIKKQNRNFWLTLSDLKNGKIHVILNSGRILLGSSGTQFDQEEERQLRQLDDNTKTGGKRDFYTHRIQLQRRILAQRLGLSGILQAVSSGQGGPEVVTSNIASTISNDDLLVSVEVKRQRHMDRILWRRKKQNSTDIDTDDENKNSIRALLVMEMKRQGGSMAESHRNPQTLLATELIYRMFDPSWHVRHGALLGISAVMRAWKAYKQSNDSFGLWPHDIFARCICALALDRFGDYSGASVQATASVMSSAFNSSTSGGVVAPVREMTGQVCSIIFLMAPYPLQDDALSLLFELANMEEWEVRQGSLVALKYIAAVVVNEMVDFVQAGRRKQLLLRICELAIQHLDDSSDDVQSVAAQIVSNLVVFAGSVSKTTADRKNVSSETTLLDVAFVIQKASNPLWLSLQRNRLVSTSIVDLVHLFSALVCRDCNLVLHSLDPECTIWVALEKLLNLFVYLLVECKYDSVHLSMFEAIGAIAAPVATLCSCATTNSLRASDSSSQTDTKSVRLAQKPVAASFCQLMDSIYGSYYFQETYTASIIDAKDSHRPQSDAPSKIDVVRRKTWMLLVKAAQHILREFCAGKQSLFAKLEDKLILRYFGISVKGVKETAFIGSTTPLDFVDIGEDFLLDSKVSASTGSHLQLRHELADALGCFLVGTEELRPCHNDEERKAMDRRRNFLELCLCAFVESPWASKCEAGLVLHRSIQSRINRDRDPKQTSLFTSLLNCRPVFQRMLARVPVCIEVEKSRIFALHPNFSSVCAKSFVCGLTMIHKRELDGRSAATAVLELWKKEMSSASLDLSKGGVAEKNGITPSLMRINVAVVAAIISGGSDCLPEKLTPLVRALMTSIKNETDSPCQALTCSEMSNLLNLLGCQSNIASDLKSNRTKAKILNNLCDMVCSAEPACSNSSRVIHSLIRELPAEETLKSIAPLWSRIEILVSTDDLMSLGENMLINNLTLLRTICQALARGQQATKHIINVFLDSMVQLSCIATQVAMQRLSSDTVKLLCGCDTHYALKKSLSAILDYLEDREHDMHRLRASQLLKSILETVGMDVRPFVRSLLPVVMSLMVDPTEGCARLAANMFASLVRVAPLVRKSVSIPLASVRHKVVSDLNHADLVIDHLIHGKPFPACALPESISAALQKGGIQLRPYQMEGLSWLRFLQTVNLNGALCDSMGLGKTLQALLGVALSHQDVSTSNENKHIISLVVCPSTVVGHWMREIERFFPDEKVFQALALTGNASERKSLWCKQLQSCNIVVTNYAVLRNDVQYLSNKFWQFCILDEGHLLKNPKTATARAARKIRAHHKLILTGTPVQNKVHEVWAAFDFLMPNFLGSATDFVKEFAKPISKGQLPGASAEDIGLGMEKLKILHQQVLPFILRREKEQVLKELPPKTITIIPCSMSDVQRQFYSDFCTGSHAKKALDNIQRALLQPEISDQLSLGAETLKTLLFLRLLCTHPSLVSAKVTGSANAGDANMYVAESSGKLMALSELLCNAGIHTNEMMAADNDSTLLYCEPDYDDDVNEVADVLNPSDQTELIPSIQPLDQLKSKCLIFAQFTHSLDVVEEFLLKRRMPSVRYLRLDSRVPAEKRSDLVDRFNRDESIKVMILTTRIGGLGLNLTGADTVIFLEHDWNPHADLQAMDRAHRIGQKRTVNVYKLVTIDSIEEKIMKLQEKKLAMSNAIVNTDNSTMYSMGTDRLLDIFTVRSDSGDKKDTLNDEPNLDVLIERYMDDYASLSLDNFVRGFK